MEDEENPKSELELGLLGIMRKFGVQVVMAELGCMLQMRSVDELIAEQARYEAGVFAHAIELSEFALRAFPPEEKPDAFDD